ncbi:lanthionine synthetase LanC family protein [Nonomuraea dietziae]|uniref:Lantibiotic modifying enzyme n=1 Tax=Nonomuraea dietziae TaxID=65515 RepID=A0A7W5YPF0_9ACTN|nr:lanthionine synthetase LanC family protein [Nonomuraea dietziae]MBB3725064.1 lantibiotic modifying enzyme [Nonomuraea dietziae]
MSPIEAAVQAAGWIRACGIDDDRGRHWRAGERPALPHRPASLYSGAAGIVLFFLELAAATGDDSYLEDAELGARHLSAVWAEQSDPTFHDGLAGVVFALAEAGWAIDDSFTRAAAAAADLLAAAGPTWTGDPSQRGDGGIILTLLHASAMLGEPAYERVAVEAGLRIAALPVPGHRFGAEPPADLPVDAVTPGFLSGTAGTAFLLARLHAVTGDPRFLEAANSGAGFVRAVSEVTGACALVPHHVPQGRHLHYLGFCSGSAGVARMFHELGDSDWVDRLVHGILTSGVPHRRTPGFWDVMCQCCGAAGLLELFVGLWERDDCRAFARVLGEHLVNASSQGRWWQAYRRLRPHEITADTGYMVGAAGIGAALLHLDAAERGDSRRLVLLPDNPFPLAVRSAQA